VDIGAILAEAAHRLSGAIAPKRVAGDPGGGALRRSEGRCCHSELSVVKTVMMSSTPREIPPL
jgi:hypothetical protein